MTYSDCIDRLAKLLRSSGLTVNLFAKRLPAHVGGRYYDHSKRIWINESSARRALLTLAHEAGHWLGYRLHPGAETPRAAMSPRREREAFVYGWRFLVLVGADKIVSRKEWAEHHGP